MFSSIAGRFGNAGQTDYAAANDLLCKSISNLRRSRPDTRGVAIDWTAWAGIGMASRGSIPKMMEMAGIDMLPPEVGVPIVRRELTAAGDGGEVLVAGSLGVLIDERHPTGGLDPDLATERAPRATGPMTGRIAAMTPARRPHRAHRPRPVGRQAFLDDHRIDGTPVLPGVMGMEGFAEAARALLPDWHVIVARGRRACRRRSSSTATSRAALELRALLRDGGDGTIDADCRLVGRRTLPGQGEQETVHFSGRAVPRREVPEAPPADEPGTEETAGDTVDREAVYRVYFHGPAYQVLDARLARERDASSGASRTSFRPRTSPPGNRPRSPPRLVELCFQTAGVWELGTAGRMALPTHVDRVQRFAGVDERGPLWAVVRPRDDGGVDAEVVGPDGRVRVRLEGYRTITLPGDVEPQALEPIRAAMG